MRRIKVGVKFYESNKQSEYFIGRPKQLIRICTSEEKALALELMSGKSEEEILHIEGVDVKVFEKVLSELEVAQLLDTEQGALKVSQRFISKVEERVEKSKKGFVDAALLQLQSRAIPELTQSTWIDGVRDGGINTLTNRQSYLVEISGQNRVATIIYSLLLASGFTQARFAPGSRTRSAQIGDKDIGAATIGASDVGKAFINHCESLRRELSLFPLEREHNYLDELSTPDLIIHCGEIDPEKLSLWMSTGQNFLVIPTPQADSAEIGPLVIPGKSPCLRCHLLATQEQSQLQQRFDTSQPRESEYPQIAAHFIAAMAASFVANFFDTVEIDGAKQELVGTVVTVDYQSLSHPRSAVIPRHPLCGCAFQ
ncbi:Bacteriocin biosynthesis, cyclodehydratase domain [Candidatus Nanopelagicaceae bacterium]